MSLKLAVKYVWDSVVKDMKLRPREYLKLDYYSPRHLLDNGEGIEIRAEWYMSDVEGNLYKGMPYRHESIELDIEVHCMMAYRTPEKLITYLRSQLRYLAIKVRPMPKPRNYRILRRHVVISPAPRFRSRLRR